jgi:hypothetical protein
MRPSTINIATYGILLFAGAVPLTMPKELVEPPAAVEAAPPPNVVARVHDDDNEPSSNPGEGAVIAPQFRRVLPDPERAAVDQ